MDFKYSFFLMALILGNLCFGVNCSSYNGKPGCPADSCEKVIDPRYPTHGGCVPKSLGGGGMSEQQAYSECGQQNKVVYNYDNGNWGCGGCVNGYISQGGACVPETVNNDNNNDNNDNNDNSDTPVTDYASCISQCSNDSCLNACDRFKTQNNVDDKNQNTNTTIASECVPDPNGDNSVPSYCNFDGTVNCSKNPGHQSCKEISSSENDDGNTASDKDLAEEITKKQDEQANEVEKEVCFGSTYENGEKTARTGKNKISSACKLYSPLARIIAAGVMGTLSEITRGEINKEVHKIEDNIANLERVRDAIVENQGKGLSDCAENDFSNPEKPHCYCYTMSGSVNRSRDPAGVCAALFPYYRPPVVSTTPTLRGCVKMDGSFDRDCQCRQQVQNGQNNCMKVQSFSTAGLGDNTISAIGDAGRAANSIYSGNWEGASTYNSSGGRSLAKLAKKQAEKALKKPAGTLDKITSNNIKALVSSPRLAKAAAGSNLRDAGLRSLMSSFPASTKESVDKKTGGIISKADKGYSSSGSKRRTRSTISDDTMDFGESMDFAVDMNDEKTDEIMAKKFNYTNSDIFQRPSASIFKVLSVRYQRSAYRRLFNEEDIIKADKPNKNDVRR